MHSKLVSEYITKKLFTAVSAETCFLKPECILSVMYDQFEFDYTLTLQYGDQTIPIQNVTQLVPFVLIDTLPKFQAFVVFAVDHNLVYDTYPEGLAGGHDLYIFLDTADGVTAELRETYAFQPNTWDDLGNGRYQIYSDCLCNRQGQLARICFTWDGQSLTTTKQEIYAESSPVDYIPYE